MILSSRCGALFGFGDGRGLVGLAVSEHGEEDVDAAAGQADDGSVVAFAFGAFAVVVGAAGRVFETGECRQE